MSDSGVVRSVARTVDIILVVCDGPMTLAQIANSAGLSKATTHRLLASLCHKQFLLQDPLTGQYMMGVGCFDIAAAVNRGSGALGVIARPILERLLLATNETVTLHVRVGSQRICIEELPSTHVVRYSARLGEANPIYAGSAGKLLLAFTPADEREKLLDHLLLEPVTKATISNRDALEREIEMIRNQGYSTSKGERVAGAAAISAPIFVPNGTIVAALTVLGPETRMTKDTLREMRPVLVNAAEEISRRFISHGKTEI